MSKSSFSSSRNSVTAYSIFDDALKTGELDCINGGMSFDRIFSIFPMFDPSSVPGLNEFNAGLEHVTR
ncbi:hypothetical protein V6N11_044285 [Hibiscus sabdariffa]|uniref:Uncharacterized protein n=1 Tax=Hibiscus sabdariffa TaxID=183260 RepID=A0ABR2RF41_9ROSI